MGQCLHANMSCASGLRALFWKVRNGEFADAKAIKQAITNWRPDYLRA